VIRIGLVIAICMLGLLVAASGRPPAPAPNVSTSPQPINLTIRFKMAEDLG
jgi:hypothetical protein